MAITYGMSVKEFWEDDPNLFWAYRFYYYNKMTNQQEIFNYNAWLQGAYIYEAIGDRQESIKIYEKIVSDYVNNEDVKNAWLLAANNLATLYTYSASNSSEPFGAGIRGPGLIKKDF